MVLQIDASELPTTALRMAMVVVVAGPMMFVSSFFQRFFVRGRSVGAIKN